MNNKLSIFFIRCLNEIKSLFLNGLLAILPLALTVGVFSYFFQFLCNWIRPLQRFEPDWLRAIPYADVMAAFIIMLSLGAILRFLITHELIKLLELPLKKIPLLSQVYFGIKQLIGALNPQDKTSTFQKVVLVPFPQQHVYSIGFMTGIVPHALMANNETTYISVFIPTTPNPTTGFYVMVREHECITTDLTRQEAMTIIMSGGVIRPDRFTS